MAKRYTQEEIEGFMKEAKESTQTEVANKYGFSVTNFAKWRSKYKPRRARAMPTTPAPSNNKELDALRQENKKLKAKLIEFLLRD